jgi:signal peptidase II
MKGKYIALLIIGILLVDQALKIYVKTHFFYGEHKDIIGRWFQLNFIENDGMAWGWKLSGQTGKLILSIFRMIAVVWGTFYLVRIRNNGTSRGFIICCALIYAGALGNLLDSAFFGLIFDKGISYASSINPSYDGIAVLTSHGYGSFLHGNVVDMLYFPIIRGRFPSWVPFWGGERLEFFNAIFNIADASISVGVISLLVFQKKLFRKGADNDKSVNASPVVE